MNALVTALFLTASPAGVDPSTLVDVRFYTDLVMADPDDKLDPDHLHYLEFTAPGFAVANDCDYDDYKFTARAEGAVWILTARSHYGTVSEAYWRWLDDDTAVTNLWAGYDGVLSRARPTPHERRQAYGDRLAGSKLPAGKYRLGGDVLFSVEDGRLTWSPGVKRGFFFTCWMSCELDAPRYLCYRPPTWRPDYTFGLDGDAATGRPTGYIDMCLGRQLEPGPAIQRVPPKAGKRRGK